MRRARSFVASLLAFYISASTAAVIVLQRYVATIDDDRDAGTAPRCPHTPLTP